MFPMFPMFGVSQDIVCHTVNPPSTTTSAMDLFRTAKVVKLQSSIGKYLYAREDGEVRQRSDASRPNVLWTVERVSSQAIRLKSCFGDYLTRNHEPLMLPGSDLETEVVQTPPYLNHPKVNWTPVRSLGWSHSQVMLVTKPGGLKALRGGGRRPPYDQLVTIDVFDLFGMQKNPTYFTWVVHIVSSNHATTVPYSPLSYANLPVQAQGSQQQQSQSPDDVHKPANYNVVQYNNNVTLAAPNTSLVNSGQNANGSGRQNNGNAKAKNIHPRSNVLPDDYMW